MFYPIENPVDKEGWLDIRKKSGLGIIFALEMDTFEMGGRQVRNKRERENIHNVAAWRMKYWDTEMRKGGFVVHYPPWGNSPETPLKIKLLSLSLYIATIVFIWMPGLKASPVSRVPRSHMSLQEEDTWVELQASASAPSFNGTDIQRHIPVVGFSQGWRTEILPSTPSTPTPSALAYFSAVSQQLHWAGHAPATLPPTPQRCLSSSPRSTLVSHDTQPPSHPFPQSCLVICVGSDSPTHFLKISQVLHELLPL